MIDMSSTVLAIIPARGGSKGIPRKNLARIHGQPMLWWTISAAKAASESLFLVVTTDDVEIADFARGQGAVVVDRPAQLATDTSPTEHAVAHALDHFSSIRPFEEVLLLQATSPIRRTGTIDRALSQFRSSGVDSLVGVVESSPFLWQGARDDAVPSYDVNARPRRQDLKDSDTTYQECGSIYITRAEAFRASLNRISGRVGLLVLDNDEGIDIDTPYDLIRAEQIMTGLDVRI